MGKKFSTKLPVPQPASGKQKAQAPAQTAFAEADSEDEPSLDSIPSSPEPSDEVHGDARDGQHDTAAAAQAGSDSGSDDGEGEGSDMDADLAEFDSDDDDDNLGIMDDEFDTAVDSESDDGVDSDGGGGEGGEEQDGSSGDGEDVGEGQEGDGKGQGAAGPQHRKGSKFSEGGKGASFAKAFAKVLQRPVRGAPGSQPAEVALTGEAAHAQTAQLLRGAVGDAAILSESATHLKRQAEEAKEAAASRAAKRARMEAKKRGHMMVPHRGHDPAHDVREKGLQKLATKGVVLLFNAVAKAQRAQQDAAAAGSKAPAKAAKVALATQLEAGKAAPIGGMPALGGIAGDKAGGVLGLLGSKQGSKAGGAQQQAAQEEGGPGWKVLQDSFTGLAGSGKMKDWDKEVSDSEGEGAGVHANSDSDAGGDEGW